MKRVSLISAALLASIVTAGVAALRVLLRERYKRPQQQARESAQLD
jgi:hypothetical protein